MTLESTATTLSSDADMLCKLLERLVEGDKLPALIGLLRRAPINITQLVSDHLKPYDRYESSALRSHYTDLLFELFVSNGGQVAAQSYVEADRVIATQPAPLCDGGPATSLGLLHSSKVLG